MTLDDLISRVYEAPRGSRVAAVLDLGGTVCSGAVTDAGLPELQGKTAEELRKLGQREFDSEIAGRLHSEVWELVEAHHLMGHTVVLACAAPRHLAEPAATVLDAAHLLCSEPELADGVATGQLAGPPLTGPARAAALGDLAARKDIDLTWSFAYGSGEQALDVLGCVGNPVAVQPGPDLRAHATDRGWPVLACVERGKPPSLIERVRTGGFYGGFAAGVGLGIGAGVFSLSKRAMLDAAFSRGADLALAAAGVKVRVVEGAEHLASSQPGIFVFNHQSMIDPVIVMTLVRQKITGVAKKEARDMPGFGKLFQFAGVAFVDRGNTAQAKQVLAPAVDKVREEGLSLLLAPEGTRSATPRLGAFKKGAFHIAMQTGAPMVPIVIRNAGEVWWRGSRFIRSGTVEVVVLPPLDSTTWQADELGAHMADVREMFVDTLARWPGRPLPPAL
ncbi:MAG TPA: 1-acyl-sn-glycerol-3-phosphate acyltransferase [Pseudonocardia sp.]|nr:1-acyl-sn-glycerol-3-phosphate acyltransferase [Pseudonocardia sp.]